MRKQHLIAGVILGLIGAMPLCAISNSDEITQSLELEPDIDKGAKIYPLCASCHLDNGWGKKDGSFPVIAGQHRKVLIKQLADIRARNRQNPTMYPFSDPEAIGGAQAIADVTAYIASLPPNPTPGTGDGQRIEPGEKTYRKQCVQCHGDNGQGNNDAFYPRIKGQHYAYLVRQLKWIRDGYRKNSDPAMALQVKSLSDDDIKAVADFISRL
jgi:cytochrome c553